MRDFHLYIIFALLLLVLFCMMNHTARYSEGFYATPTQWGQIKNLNDADFNRFQNAVMTQKMKMNGNGRLLPKD